jgi:hypothetical protein
MPVESGAYGGGDGDTVRLQQSASQGNGWYRDSITAQYPTFLRPFIDKFVAERKKKEAERCAFVFDAHSSKAITEGLWRGNVKAIGGFIYISLEDSHMDKTAL